MRRRQKIENEFRKSIIELLDGEASRHSSITNSDWENGYWRGLVRAALIVEWA